MADSYFRRWERCCLPARQTSSSASLLSVFSYLILVSSSSLSSSLCTVYPYCISCSSPSSFRSFFPRLSYFHLDHLYCHLGTIWYLFGGFLFASNFGNLNQVFVTFLLVSYFLLTLHLFISKNSSSLHPYFTFFFLSFFIDRCESFWSLLVLHSPRKFSFGFFM